LKNSFLEGRRFSAPVRGGKFLAATLTDSSLDPALKDRDCAELPVQKSAEKAAQISSKIFIEIDPSGGVNLFIYSF
jgi:hypothetical protein